MKLAFRIVLWSGAVLLTVFGLLMMSGALDGSGSDAAGRGMSAGIGLIVALIGGAAIAALALARLWRGFFVIGGCILALPFVLVAIFTVMKSFDEAHNAQFTADVHSGRYNFGDQPALLGVGEAVSKNDTNAIRAAAKAVTDLNAAGRDGMTLLFFAVNEALERPELVSAVETLLSLGADANYHNDSANSFALAQSVSGEVRLLRAMLDAGGNPNSLNGKDEPIVFNNWFMETFRAQRPQRLRLLLDRGADVDSITPLVDHFSLLLYCANMGQFEPQGYVDALELLNRGADFNYTADGGITVDKLLQKQQREFAERGQTPPPEFEKLWNWLNEHGVAREE